MRRYVRDLTEVMRRTVAEHGVESGRIDQHIGLWANRESPGKFRGTESEHDLVKLGAIGVRISRWITMHGFALNVAPDMRLFSLIVPCGIREYGVASLAELTTGSIPSVANVARAAFAALTDVLDAEPDASSWLDGEPRQSGAKARRLRDAAVADTAVVVIALRLAAARPEFGAQMDVVDARRFQVRLQRLPVELRVVSAVWGGSHVGNGRNAVLSQQHGELRQLVIRVADCVQDMLHAVLNPKSQIQNPYNSTTTVAATL